MFIVFKYFLRFYLFMERGEGRDKERERYISSVASHRSPSGDKAHNPSKCPDWELNQWPFISQAGTQSTEPHQPGLDCSFSKTQSLNFTLVIKAWPLNIMVLSPFPWNICWRSSSVLQRFQIKLSFLFQEVRN